MLHEDFTFFSLKLLLIKDLTLNEYISEKLPTCCRLKSSFDNQFGPIHVQWYAIAQLVYFSHHALVSYTNITISAATTFLADPSRKILSIMPHFKENTGEQQD